MVDIRHTLAGFILLMLGGAVASVDAQTVEDKVDEYVRKVSEGRYGEIRKEIDRSPGGGRTGDPGMIYLEGLIAPDGTTSIRLFQLVADSLGANPWRDDALARMVEFYSRINDRPRASEAFRILRTDYPATPYITTGYLGRVTTGETTDERPDTSGRVVAVYAIQVGAFSVFENAEKLAHVLKSKGFSAIIYDNLLDGKHLLHLVWVGRYDREEDAAPVMKKIEELTGIKGVLREQMIWRRW